jgi:hypothetical protein
MIQPKFECVLASTKSLRYVSNHSLSYTTITWYGKLVMHVGGTPRAVAEPF